MFEHDEIAKDAGRHGGEDFPDKGAPKGDGMHHHEIHEDEGGGYHSKHTHPDGQVEHADHATYEEAADHMDEKFGHGEARDEEEGEGDGGDMSPDDIAGSYGRAARED